MALTKVSTAMFDTAAQSSDLNIDANTLFVDVSTNRVGIGTTSPSVPLEVSGQLKAGGITYPTSDGTNGQALVTNGSGVASFATVAPTAGTGVTVSGTTVSIGQAVGTSSNVTFNNLVVAGTLTVNGATNTNSATNTTIEDILIELGTGTSGSPANDAGLVLERGSSDNVFIGWDESADTFTVGTGSFTGASSGNLTITPATAVFGGLTVDTSTLVVDASNNRVGIGNASPDVSLDVGSFTDAVHVPVGTTAQRPTGAAGYFRYNSTLNKFEGYTTSWGEIGGGGSNTFTTNVYTGDGSTTAFTLSQSVDSVNNLIVFIDGVYQVPTAAYTVSGTTLTMTAAPANTRKIVAYSVQSAISGTNLNQNSFTGNGSAVAFTLSIAPVNENNTQVFLDGVYQHKSTYATSGTTLTFDTAPASGVAIEVMVFTQTEINVPVDGTITTAKLVADAVTSAKIADDAVGADQLASNAVVTASIVNDAVTSAKIADDAVGNDQLASGLTLGGNTAATLSTAAQPNITSVGTLTALTSSGTITGQKLVSSEGILELDDNGTHNGIINAPASLRLNIDSDGNSTGESFQVGANATNISSSNILFQITETGSISTPTSGTSNVRLGVNAGLNIASGGNYNVLVGDLAGAVISTGDNNVALGFGALNDEDTGSRSTAIGSGTLSKQNNNANNYNTALGFEAGREVLTGIRNTLLGAEAALDLDEGNDNIAIGYQALTNDTTGSRNVAIGNNSLDAQNFTSATHAYNTAVGYGAGGSVTTATQNVLIGGLAGFSNQTAEALTAVGYSAGYNATGGDNTFVGEEAGFYVTSGTDNTYVGSNAGPNQNNSTGNNNTAMGAHAMTRNTSGHSNVAMGVNSLYNVTTGVRNVALGTSSMENGTVEGEDNVAVGHNSGNSMTTGSNNTLIGAYAGDAINTGNHNVAIGHTALGALQGADYNVAIGFQAADNLTTGHTNVAIGKNAMNNTGTAHAYNVAIGGETLMETSQSSQTAVGFRALRLATTGQHNTAVGYESMEKVVTGDQSSCFGKYAGKEITSGGNNTLIGHEAGKSINTGGGNNCLGKDAGDVITDGIRNICIGQNANPNQSNSEYHIVLGHDITGNGDNKISMGRASATGYIWNSYTVNANWTQVSDERAKKNITNETLGLSFINRLRPVTFNWRTPSEFPDDYKEAIGSDGTEDPRSDLTIHGMIAQEVKAAMDAESNTTFNGWEQDEKGVQALSIEGFVTPLINAVKELSAEVTSLKAEVAALKGG